MNKARSYGEEGHWHPAGLRFRPVRFVVSWLVAAVSVGVAAAIVPGVALEQAGAGTRPFILHPDRLALATEPIVGTAGVHDVLAGWRTTLQAPADDHVEA
jgi:hypothetical protein